MEDDMVTIPVTCAGTKHFYSMVRILNRQVGRGCWTTRGRIVRKLRRLDRANYWNQDKMPAGAMTVMFKVPQGYEDISTTLNLWSENGQR